MEEFVVSEAMFAKIWMAAGDSASSNGWAQGELDRIGDKLGKGFKIFAHVPHSSAYRVITTDAEWAEWMAEFFPGMLVGPRLRPSKRR